MKNAAIVKLRKLSITLKKMPGAVLLLGKLRKLYSNSDRSVKIDDFDGEMTIDLRLGEHMQSQIFWYGYYNRDIVMAMGNILHPGMVVFDVGGNIGEIALCAARRVGDAGSVYSFEPIPGLYDTLQYNLSRNGLDQAHPIPVGVSNKVGSARIYVCGSRGGDGTVNEGLGTLYPSEATPLLSCEIKLTTLDDFCNEMSIDRLDLIKIDVEGSELDVLKGGAETLKRFRPRLIIEVQRQSAEASGATDVEILKHLEGLGYSFFSIGRKAKLQVLYPDQLKRFQNVLCVPNETLV